MAVIPEPVTSSIGFRRLSPRPPFKGDEYQAFCNNCPWESFFYHTEDEAADRADSHAERCCARINMMRALTVEVVPFEAQNLLPGAMVLLKDLRVLHVDNVDVFDDQVMVTYELGADTEFMMLPLGHVVKVVQD